MHIKRIYLVLALITIMAFVTAWMQMQIVRQGYAISQMSKYKDQLTTDHKKLEVQLTALKSPQHLLPGPSGSPVKRDNGLTGPDNPKPTSNIIIPEVITLGEFNNRVKNLARPAGPKAVPLIGTKPAAAKHRE